MRESKSTNPQLIHLIRFLRKQSGKNNALVWKEVAERLAKAKRKRISVNVSRLNRYTDDQETVVVPGKVLGAGRVDNPITVAAFSFSEKAKRKIRDAQGNTLSILQLAQENPNGSNIKIIG